ncbi:hypothetical protein [Macrococcus equipercicus]|uniref:Uncharacterized protein n=1 Tax=Macrococcus equipercicus TaxID=69967 RepID=A0A9Q9BWT2_9STAP|nr:hypothetical protein [Macrococcus equipercicus]UTH14513.1 hypothetical protein KFV11_03905 [Macrococcus equipercicus]
MTDDKIEEFKDDAQKAAGNGADNNSETKEKIDSLENDHSGDEQTEDDVKQAYEQ